MTRFGALNNRLYYAVRRGTSAPASARALGGEIAALCCLVGAALGAYFLRIASPKGVRNSTATALTHEV